MAEYIDRQAALKVLLQRLEFAEAQQWSEECDTLEVLLERLNAIPTVEVRENVKGQWIYHQNARHDEYWQCSICGEKWANSIYFNVGATSFCPNCGADMRGKHNDKQGVAEQSDG